MRTISIFGVICLVIGFCLSAFAGDVDDKMMHEWNIAMNSMVIIVGEQRDKACSKQETPAVCEMEFDALAIELANIDMSIQAVFLHAVTSGTDMDGTKDPLRKIGENLGGLLVRLEGLVIKYNK